MQIFCFNATSVLCLERGYNGEVLERGGVALDLPADGNLLKDPAHDLSGAGLGQAGGEAYGVGLGQLADLLADVRAEGLLQFLRWLLAGL